MLRHRILFACAYLQQVLGERLMGVDSSSNSLGIFEAGVHQRSDIDVLEILKTRYGRSKMGIQTLDYELNSTKVKLKRVVLLPAIKEKFSPAWQKSWDLKVASELETDNNLVK
ncbi:hypothetical protein T4B_7956 [Trichinella pseudospiralis]|uniref:Uncharacterized protein n=1 Tax=Trichinella pseudospiralis TaxID=6337 RepID=A0A0V1IV59_TRIPS|nr:hypothetical protein T4B_7956 [Trichinella pseudospiralis]KRZ26686.1 hypothetical protein T4C_4490 [Trichinella pseudospiralis]